MGSVVFLTIGFLFSFFPTFQLLWLRWFETGSYYLHGPIAVALSLGIAFREFRRAASASLSSKTEKTLGTSLFFFGLVLQGVGAFHRINFFQYLALLLALVGLILFRSGRTGIIRHRWSIFFLLLALPLPVFALTHLAFGLRQASAEIAALFLQPFVSGASLDGNLLWLGPSSSVMISEACSGLRTFISILGIGALLAFLEKKRAYTFFVLLFSLPVAMFANSLRILTLCLLFRNGYGEFAFGAGHSWIGLSVYVFALLLLAAPARFFRRHEEKGASAGTPVTPDPLPKSFAVGVCLLALLVQLGARRDASPPPASLDLRSRVSQAKAPWSSREIPLDPVVYQILDTRDAVMQAYTREDEPHPVYAYFVTSREKRTIAHPPEICFEAEGYELIRKHESELTIPGLGAVPVTESIYQRRNYTLLVQHWYRLNGESTSSYLLHQLRWSWAALRGAGTQAEMIRLSTPVDPDHPETARARLRRFARESLPPILGAIP